MNPYAWGLAGFLAVLLAIGSFSFGVKYQRGQEARAVLLVEKVREQAQLGAAEAIAQIKINNTTIRQQLETQVRENTVYRDCKLDPDAFRLLNDALSGASGQSAGRGELSGADSADR
jgi:hypothetical protein